MLRLLFGAFAALAIAGCATPQITHLQFKHFLVTADDTVELSVLCGDEIRYTLTLQPGEPVAIGGPETLCVFKAGEPVGLTAEPVWYD